MLYLVKLRREIEFENAYEAPDAGVAEDLAKLECGVHGAVVDEQIIVEEVQPALTAN